MNTYLIAGHYCKIVQTRSVYKYVTGADCVKRVELSCVPHCCTHPYGIHIRCSLEDLKSFEKSKRKG